MKTTAFFTSLLLLSFVVADEPPKVAPEHSRTWVPSNEEREKQFADDVKRITIRDMSTLHLLLTRKCIKTLPASCRLNYQGALRVDDGRAKQVIEGEEGHRLLAWDVEDDDGVIFTLNLSLTADSQTVTAVRIDGQTFHVNVSYVDDELRVNMPLRRLGGRSVRDTLDLIHAVERKP